MAEERAEGPCVRPKPFFRHLPVRLLRGQREWLTRPRIIGESRNQVSMHVGERISQSLVVHLEWLVNADEGPGDGQHLSPVARCFGVL